MSFQSTYIFTKHPTKYPTKHDTFVTTKLIAITRPYDSTLIATIFSADQ